MKKLNTIVLALVLFTGLMSPILFAADIAVAQNPEFCQRPEYRNLPECQQGQAVQPAQEINTQGDCSVSLHPRDCAIMAYIRIITDGLTIIVGVVVTGMLVFGGIQYSASGSNPQMVQAAKKHISQALLALGIWIFMAAFLQWLIPGGIF